METVSEIPAGTACERRATCPDPGLEGCVRVGWRSLADGSFSPAPVWPGYGSSPVYVNVRPDWKFVYTDRGTTCAATITDRDGTLVESYEIPVANGRVQIAGRGKRRPKLMQD